MAATIKATAYCGRLVQELERKKVLYNDLEFKLSQPTDRINHNFARDEIEQAHFQVLDTQAKIKALRAKTQLDGLTFEDAKYLLGLKYQFKSPMFKPIYVRAQAKTAIHDAQLRAQAKSLVVNRKLKNVFEDCGWGPVPKERPGLCGRVSRFLGTPVRAANKQLYNAKYALSDSTSTIRKSIKETADTAWSWTKTILKYGGTSAATGTFFYSLKAGIPTTAGVVAGTMVAMGVVPPIVRTGAKVIRACCSNKQQPVPAPAAPPSSKWTFPFRVAYNHPYMATTLTAMAVSAATMNPMPLLAIPAAVGVKLA